MKTLAFARFRMVVILAGVYLAIGAATRAVLWWQFGAPLDIGATSLPGIFAGGLLNDAIESLYVLAPLTVYLLILPDRWHRTRWNRTLLTIGMAVTIAALMYLAVTEYYFFEEFNSRFNIVAFDYLVYPTEVVGDVWQEYPVVRTALAVVTVTLIAVAALRRRSFPHTDLETPFKHRLVPFAVHFLALICALAFYPTDAVSVSANRVTNELVQNGLSSFFRAAGTNEIDYHAYYASAGSRQNLELLTGHLSRGGGRFTALNEGRLDRQFPARPAGLGRLNVVLVSSESFGAEFSKLHGSLRDLTPNFDAYALKGLWFANTYASGTRTVRGLEALTSSFPPIPTVSILRRPGNEHIATWGSVMRDLGYRTSFLYGGYGYFDNMNYFYENNGFEVLDRNAIGNIRFENVWGVSDEDLFDRALQHFDDVHSRGEPFFSIVMTTSNHKPFTFRKGLESFGIPEEGGGRAAGVKYADYALGYFLQEAQKHPWFDDTLFVVVADHGARVYGKADIPLKTYEIPLMMYAPKHLQPRQIDTLTTQIDVAPTVLGLLGLPYRAPFFGQDVLNTPQTGRVAFFNHNHDVAIYRDGQIVVYGLHKSVRTFNYDRAADRFTPAPRNAALEQLGIAYFQTASELFATHRYEPATSLDVPSISARASH